MHSCLRLLSIFGIFAFLVGCAAAPQRTLQPLDQRVGVVLTAPDGRTVDVRVEVSDTAAERERGLMQRETLDGGMLFVFAEQRELGFWMKNTLIPLDILFFDADGAFVSHASMIPCTKDPCRIYTSHGPAQYALEVVEGFVSAHGVGPGWTLQHIPSHKGV